MANAPHDANFHKALLGTSNADGTTTLPVYVDSATNRLLVSPSAIDAATDDILVYVNTAKDGTGTDYVPIVDADGHLQIDVLSGGGGGTLISDGDVQNAANTGQMILGGDGSTYRLVKTDADGNIQADIVAALPAGTNAIGKLAANSGVDIGDVDILSMPGTAAEAAALPSSFVVIAADDGVDTHPLQVDASGNLKAILQANSGVDIGDVDVASLPAGNLGQQAMAASLSTVPASNITDATYIGDIKFGEALPSGTNNLGSIELAAGNATIGTVKIASNDGTDIGSVDVLTLPSVELKAGNATIGTVKIQDILTPLGQSVIDDTNDAIKVVQATAGLLNVQAVGDIAAAATDSGNPVKVGGKYNSTQPTLTDGQRGDIEISSRGAMKTVLFNNDSAVAIAGTSDNADGVAVSASAIALRTIGRTTIFNGTTWDRLYGTTKGIYTQGDIADDSPTPSNPVLIGGTAKETDGTDPGSVSAEDDVARAITDRNRRLLVNDIHPNLWSANGTSLNAGTAQIKAAPGANLSLYVTDIIFSNGATAGSMRLISNTTAGTPTNSTAYMSFAVNGGAVVNFRTPIRVAANVDLGIQSSGVSGHGWTINGYIAP